MTGQDPNFEADGELRSSYVRELTLAQIRNEADQRFTRSEGTRESIPATLVQYWHDSDSIPPDVQDCMDTWSELPAQGVARHLFDDRSARAYIADRFSRLEVEAFDRCRHPAMRSDFFRMCFVLADGGLYVDADDALRGDRWADLFEGDKLKLHPLCYDIATSQMLSDGEIREANLTPAGRIFYVNNNPLAAPPGHPVIRRALARATRILVSDVSKPEIQSTTGPGNVTISLVEHAYETSKRGHELGVDFLLDWGAVAQTRWHLGYRNDDRNWRNMD